jgi:hypothetical protein
VLGSSEPLSPSRREARFIHLTTAAELLVRLGDFEKARARVLEARRLVTPMRQAGWELEERLLLKVNAIRLYAAGRRSEALQQAQKQLALLPGRTDPVLSANFEAVELLARIRTYATAFDAAACTSATDRLVRIWNDLAQAHPDSSLVQAQREHARSLRKEGCIEPATLITAGTR